MEKTGARAFYGGWAKRTIFHSLGWGDGIASVAGSVATVVTHYLDKSSALSVSAWSWEIPVWGLAAAMALRLVVAPYEMWLEQRAKAEAIPPDMRPFDISLWDSVDQFRLYQAACLWIGVSPPIDQSAPLPHQATVVAHRIKAGLSKMALDRNYRAANGNQWHAEVITVLLGQGPAKEMSNGVLLTREDLCACAEIMGEQPAFLFEVLDNDRRNPRQVRRSAVENGPA